MISLPSIAIGVLAAVIFMHAANDTESYAELDPFPNLAGRIVTHDGVALHCKTWGVSDGVVPRAILLIAHGGGEHVGRYDALAQSLAHDGYTVFGCDFRGHGYSQGHRFHVDIFEEYVEDLRAAYMHATTLGRQKVFIVGHSMGALVALKLSLLNQAVSRVTHAHRSATPQVHGPLELHHPLPHYGGIVLAAPCLSVQGIVDSLLGYVARGIRAVSPRLQLRPIDYTLASSDASIVRSLSSDPLVYHRGMRVGVVAELLRATSEVNAELDRLSSPVLVLHGRRDAFCSAEGSLTLFSKSQTRSKQLRTYEHSLSAVSDGMYASSDGSSSPAPTKLFAGHALLTERHSMRRVIEDITLWISGL